MGKSLKEKQEEAELRLHEGTERLEKARYASLWVCREYLGVPLGCSDADVIVAMEKVIGQARRRVPLDPAKVTVAAITAAYFLLRGKWEK